MSEHDVDASSAFFCFDTTWTHPSQVQPVRFLQLGLSHMWQHSPVVMPSVSTHQYQPQWDEGPLGQGEDPSPLPGHSVQSQEQQQQLERLCLCVCTGFTRKPAQGTSTEGEQICSGPMEPGPV